MAGPQTKAYFIEPMLLLNSDRLPEGADWQYELKLDGYRAIAFKSGGTVRLRSRNDKDFGGRYLRTTSSFFRFHGTSGYSIERSVSRFTRAVLPLSFFTTCLATVDLPEPAGPTITVSMGAFSLPPE